LGEQDEVFIASERKEGGGGLKSEFRSENSELKLPEHMKGWREFFFGENRK
jgi:hypothetical protein